MDPDLILARLEQTLEQERIAIRSLNGARVEACAAEKTALVAQLAQVDAQRFHHVAPRLRLLVARLRQNGVLLVHARGILADVLRVKGALLNPSLSSLARATGPETGARLSVRG